MRRIVRTATGVRLLCEDGDFPSYDAELWVALGGPLGNLIGNALLVAVFLLTRQHAAHQAIRALCRAVLPLSLFLGIWNLMPIRGFDGGRILCCLLLRGRQGERLSFALRGVERLLSVTSATCFLLLWLLSVYLLLRTGRAFSLFWFCVQLFWSCMRQEERADGFD
jgi:Zn-dependent protease